ncbi:Lrp/AsnC family transcriptional regulator [Myceligenerans xiligouense]|uniref:AsnC family transcriptional regulator n=1 Tax=Myceligenerans xiligouense TaxID=253184 RepID=A0A3N4YM57_9MICO|nr:Lrp/AsnC family transcriptional regulator [Myceligenerans xiligouense]RPF21743.1 AsnC family transcriptional regulator [Myceligenerans xiligouense]
MTREVRLDSVDLAILRELQHDGRLANKALAQRVGVAPSTCLARTQRLQDSGVIRGYRAEIDPAAVGRGLQAVLAVRLASHSRPLLGPFVEWARQLPQTRAVHHVTGPDDFLVHVACTDTDDLQHLVLELTARREVGRVQTDLVFASWPGGPVTPV